MESGGGGMTRPDVPDWAALLLARLLDRPGKQNARTYKEWAEVMDCKPRTLHEAVRHLRLRGFPVNSTSGKNAGIWYEDTADGTFALYRSLRRRALEGMRTAAAVKRTAFRLQAVEQDYEQEVLWWPEEPAA